METHNRVLASTVRYIDGENTSSKEPELSDLEIWIRFKEGDENAFVHMYKNNFHQLFRYGHQFTTDTGLVEDCIQEMFINLRKRRANLSDTTSIKFYLYKSLKSKILRSLSVKNRVFFSEKLVEGYSFQINLSHEAVLINNQVDEETRVQLKNALNSLTAKQREVIIYYFYEKMSYQEITEIMSFSKVKYARELLYRAVDKLKAEMKGTKPEFFYTLFFCFFSA